MFFKPGAVGREDVTVTGRLPIMLLLTSAPVFFFSNSALWSYWWCLSFLFHFLKGHLGESRRLCRYCSVAHISATQEGRNRLLGWAI